MPTTSGAPVKNQTNCPPLGERRPERVDQPRQHAGLARRRAAGQLLDDQRVAQHVAEGEQDGEEQDHDDEQGATAVAGHPMFLLVGGHGGPAKCRNIAERVQQLHTLECGSLLPLWWVWRVASRPVRRSRLCLPRRTPERWQATALQGCPTP